MKSPAIIEQTSWIQRIDEDIRRRYPANTLPWQRKPAPGAIDYWRIHAYALDYLEYLLKRMLPLRETTSDASVWRARNHQTQPIFEVDLLAGRWSQPATSRHGNDTVSLFAAIYALSQTNAAVRLARILEIDPGCRP